MSLGRTIIFSAAILLLLRSLNNVSGTRNITAEFVGGKINLAFSNPFEQIEIDPTIAITNNNTFPVHFDRLSGNVFYNNNMIAFFDISNSGLIELQPGETKNLNFPVIVYVHEATTDAWEVLKAITTGGNGVGKLVFDGKLLADGFNYSFKKQIDLSTVGIFGMKNNYCSVMN